MKVIADIFAYTSKVSISDFIIVTDGGSGFLVLQHFLVFHKFLLAFL